MKKFVFNYLLLIIINLFFWYLYSYITAAHNNSIASFIVRVIWIIVVFKILPIIFPGFNTLLEQVEHTIKKYAQHPVAIIINKWLSLKNILLIVFVFSAFIFAPYITAKVILYFNIPMSEGFTTALLWSLNLIANHILWFLVVPSIVVSVYLYKLATRYLARRTSLLLKYKNRTSKKFYVIVLLIVFIEEIILLVLISLNLRN